MLTLSSLNGSIASSRQVQRQNKQANVCRNTQRRQRNNHIATGTEPLPAQSIIAHLVEKLSIPLLPAIGTDQKQSDSVSREKSADGIELRGKDLEDHEGEGELGEGGADIGAFKCALCGADLDELVVCKVD